MSSHFFHGEYVYMTTGLNTGKVVRFAYDNFTTFDVLQLQRSGTIDAYFSSSFSHGNWGYVITSNGGFDRR
eukprot:UN06190